MILTISTTHQPATDLGYLLMKNPDNVHTKAMSFGRTVLFFPEATAEHCTAALVLDIDPVGLVRGRDKGGQTSLFTHYVTDRPFAVTAFMSGAIARVLGSAMSGKSRERQALADTPIPLEAILTPLPARGGAALLGTLFEPLGYEVAVEQMPLDPNFPDWGDSPYCNVTLTNQVRLADLLTHLFVLIPVLDNQKHYWVGSDEVDKLLAKGEGWLGGHPEKEFIARRYLKNRRGLTRWALERLIESEAPTDGEETPAGEEREPQEEILEKPIRLNDLRMERVVETLTSLGATRVADVGCGEGKLLARLLKESSFTKVLGMDVSTISLDRAADRLSLDRMSARRRQRIELIQGSLTYVDKRLDGFDAIACVEVIEHMDENRIGAFEQAVFASARPRHVVLSTPNREYNVLFEDLPADKLRHHDHRFEWSRAEFQTWAQAVAARQGYNVRFEDIGELHVEHGAPTQMGVFSR
ncbi:MAG: 3' terminal RNA ribose 2'-O-methyltransferase Hen1 [Alphaproteobacteria bacterium]|nr:3' terminal RNA ribose 2'-O-methyltransferase Hen1 [Alphaproteobacteria bacterium]